MLKIGKSKKFHKKCHSIKNTFLFPNLHTRAPKLMIKPKNNFKKSQNFSKNSFSDKIAIFEKKMIIIAKMSKIEIHFIF